MSAGVFCSAWILALQFQLIDDAQFGSNHKRNFHLEEVSSSTIDNSFDNRFIYVQQFSATTNPLSQQQTQLIQQRQYVGLIERQIPHPFRHLMGECRNSIRQSLEDKLFTSFSYQQKRALCFESSPSSFTSTLGFLGGFLLC